MKNWIALQEQVLDVQRQQIDAAGRFAEAAGHSIKLQQSIADAAESGARTRQAWFRLWGARK